MIYSSKENDKSTGWPIWKRDDAGNITGFDKVQEFDGDSDVSLKSSVAVQGSAAMTLLTAKGECRFKAVSLSDERSIGAGGSSIGNYGDGMTSASFNSKEESNKKTTLSLAIPTGCTGLLMIYVKRASDSRSEDKNGVFFKAMCNESRCVREYNKGEEYTNEVS